MSALEDGEVSTRELLEDVIEFDNPKWCGVLIGTKGANVKRIKDASGVTDIKVDKDSRKIYVTGFRQSELDKARELLEESIEYARGHTIVSRYDRGRREERKERYRSPEPRRRSRSRSPVRRRERNREDDRRRDSDHYRRREVDVPGFMPFYYPPPPRDSREMDLYNAWMAYSSKLRSK